VVQIHKLYRGHAQQVAAALWRTGGLVWFHKNVMVVEEDVDIHDPVALDWAMTYRVNAGLGDIAFYGPSMGSQLDPSPRRRKTIPPSTAPANGPGCSSRSLQNWNPASPPAGRSTESAFPVDDERRELLAMEQLSKRLAGSVVPRRQSTSKVQQLWRVTDKSNTHLEAAAPANGARP
jgi:hypothetical protein